MNSSELLRSFLPSAFGFYDLGDVTLIPSQSGRAELALDGQTALAFTVYGDEPVLAIVLFDPTLDESLYAEMGNIIASRLADNLAARTGRKVLVSPPARLKPETIRRLMTGAGNRAELTTYHHVRPRGIIPVQVVLMPTRMESANA